MSAFRNTVQNLTQQSQAPQIPQTHAPQIPQPQAPQTPQVPQVSKAPWPTWKKAVLGGGLLLLLVVIVVVVMKVQKNFKQIVNLSKRAKAGEGDDDVPIPKVGNPPKLNNVNSVSVDPTSAFRAPNSESRYPKPGENQASLRGRPDMLPMSSGDYTQGGSGSSLHLKNRPQTFSNEPPEDDPNFTPL